MKIKIISPIISDIFDEEVREDVKNYVSETTTVDVCHLDYGPASIESEYDMALCVPNFLEKAMEAEQEGYDGIISSCFADPGVKAAKEILSIPVVGPGEAAMLYGSLLGKSFSIVTVLPNVIATQENNSKALGVYEKVASIRSADIPVLEVSEKSKLKSALLREMIEAIEVDKAHALILGCTGMLGVAKDLQNELFTLYGYDVPVIDPLMSAVKLLESQISLGIKQSKLTYMKPPEKLRVFPQTVSTSI